MASPVVYVQHKGPGRHHLDNPLDGYAAATDPPVCDCAAISLLPLGATTAGCAYSEITETKVGMNGWAGTMCNRRTCDFKLYYDLILMALGNSTNHVSYIILSCSECK